MEAVILVVTLLVLAALVICIILLLKLLRDRPAGDSGQLESALRDEFRNLREESNRSARELREEVSTGQRSSMESFVGTMGQIGKTQAEQLDQLVKQVRALTEANEARLENVRTTLDTQLRQLQEGNEKKLEQMRQVVDEKLQTTLEKRLGESFKLVGERLEAVQRGLGEMQTLATGVGDLKRVLSNVKVRGTWAEVQLGALLEQILTPDQYARNVQIRENSRETVEFAIRLPGAEETGDSHVWLPIDAKFPQEDYLRLLDAADACDSEAVQKATASLLRAVQASAKDMNEKYIDPPRTTDFAIMFLPTEGLYAEVLRQPGQVEEIQGKYRVVVAGPTTLAAILSSLRMGFQTLALERRSHEVWVVLGAVKTEFGRFGDVLAKVKKQLSAASNTIDQTEVRTRAMARKLREVEQLPDADSAALLALNEATVSDQPENEAGAQEQS